MSGKRVSDSRKNLIEDLEEECREAWLRDCKVRCLMPHMLTLIANTSWALCYYLLPAIGVSQPVCPAQLSLQCLQSQSVFRYNLMSNFNPVRTIQLNKVYPQRHKTITTKCNCFKPLNLEVVCNPGIDNWNKIKTIYKSKKPNQTILLRNKLNKTSRELPSDKRGTNALSSSCL